jgi:hypothetical protein
MTLLRGAGFYIQTPAVSAAGIVYVPKCGQDVLVFSSEGLALPPIQVLDEVIALAFDDTSETLLLTSASGSSSKVVALDNTTGVVRWKSAADTVNHCLGAAVYLNHAIIAHRNALSIFRISDGSLLSSISCHNPKFISCDAVTGRIFVSLMDDGVNHRVGVFSWDADGCTLIPSGMVTCLPSAQTSRPLAVVPALGRCTPAHLVVGSGGSRTLHIVELNSLELVSTKELPRGKGDVKGLAADPFGNALIVCSGESKAAEVFRWPLEF